MIKRALVLLVVLLTVSLGGSYWWFVYCADARIADAQTSNAAVMQQSWADTGGLDPQPGVPQLGFTPDTSAPFAVLHAPAFGKAFKRPIAEGIDATKVLDTYGIGHVKRSPLPGFPGNMLLTGYRDHNGSSLGKISTLKTGDHIYIETLWGWYQYTVKTARTVTSGETSYLNPVPFTENASDGYYLTLLIAGERKSAADSFVASAKYDKFFTRAGGAPAELK